MSAVSTAVGSRKAGPNGNHSSMCFRAASELTNKSGEVQVHSMGPEAEKNSLFDSTDAEANDFQTVLDRFNENFEPKRNAIHERATFHKRSQKEGKV